MVKRADRGARIDPVKLGAIIDAIQDNGPRDAMGDLLRPYQSWVVELVKDIELYEKWKRAVDEQRQRGRR